MKYYPVFLDLKGKACLVAGGGTVAERKVRSLLDAGADLTVVSPSLTEGLRELVAARACVYRNRKFASADLEGMFLAVAATGDGAVNESIAAECKRRSVLVNAVTDPSAGTFIVPSVVAQGDLLIAISTCGSSPALAKRVRLRLEREYGSEYAALLDTLAHLRASLPRTVADEQARRRIYEEVVDSNILALLRQGDQEGAERLVRMIVDRESGGGR